MKRQEEVERLKAAMDEAHEKAMREKYSRKMQHLEQGGHDTTQLKAHLAGNYRGVYLASTSAVVIGGIPSSVRNMMDKEAK